MKCPHCHKVIYPKSQRPVADGDVNTQPLPWIYELRYMAQFSKPIFQAVVRDGFDETDKDLMMFIERGWVEQRGDGFVITSEGRAEVNRHGF